MSKTTKYVCLRTATEGSTELPEIGVTYNTFDDGKIRESRRYEVTINEITPFEDIDKETLNLWLKEVEDCFWLYNTETDYFIKGNLENGKLVTYCRTKDTGWFGLGEWGGRLDVDGSLLGLSEDYR